MLRNITPAGHSGINVVDGMSRDGRRLDLDLLATTGQLDVASGQLTEMPFRGTWLDDGSGLVGLNSASPAAVVRRSAATGNETTAPALPDGWQIDVQAGVTIDDAGRRVGVIAHQPALADTGAFVLDTMTGAWSRPDQQLGVDGMANSSGVQLFSADGSVDVFEYRRGPVGCLGCVELWKSGPAGLTLVNIGRTGGPPTTGDTWLLDVSSDGRFVLFGSTSIDMEIATTAPSWGRLFVRDTVTGSTASVGDAIDPTVGSISDDARVIALVDLGGTPRILPRDAVGGGSFPIPASITPQDDIHPDSAIEISVNGTRVAYTDVNGAVLVADYLATGR